MKAHHLWKSLGLSILLLTGLTAACTPEQDEAAEQAESEAGEQSTEKGGEVDEDPYADVPRINVGSDFAEVSRESEAGGIVPGNDEGINCAGMIGEKPNLIVEVEEEQPVRIGVDSEADTTMIVKGPGGPYCNDDFDRLNPAIEEVLAPGTYEVYVGVYDEEAGSPAVTITARPFEQKELPEPEVDADARYRSLSLTDSFEPQEFELRAGGDQRVDEMNLAPSCVGYIAASTPDVKFDATDISPPLIISATAENDDLTLVARAPDGSWHCNDDADGSNPRLSLNQVPNGTWGVWVGTYGPSGATAQFKIEQQKKEDEDSEE